MGVDTPEMRSYQHRGSLSLKTSKNSPLRLEIQMLPMIKIINYLLLWHISQNGTPGSTKMGLNTFKMGLNTFKMGLNTSQNGSQRARRCSHGVLTDCSCTKRVAQQTRFPSQITVISVFSFSQLTLREQNGTLNKALHGRFWPKKKLASTFVRQTLRWKGTLMESHRHRQRWY